MKKIKNFIFSVIVTFYILILLFGILEIIFRLTRGVPDGLFNITQTQNNTLFVPNEELHNKSSINGEFDNVIKINSLGYRGPKFMPNKDINKIRIFAIGDSFTFGVGANDDQTVPVIMQKQLTEQGNSVEVINAGIGHASTIRHLDNLKKIHLQYKPDVVILFFDLTDLWDDWHWERHQVLDKNGEIKRFDLSYYYGKQNWWITLVQHSAFAKYFHNQVVRSFEKIKLLGWKRYLTAKRDKEKAKAVILNSKVGEFSDDILIEYDGLLFLRGRFRKELIDKNWKRTAKYLVEIKNLLKEQNIPFVIVMYPHGIFVGPDQWNEGRKTWGFEQNKLYTDYYAFDLMNKFCYENNIPFINTLPNFLSADKNQKYFYDWDGHMTPDGYKIVAITVTQNPLVVDILHKIPKPIKNIHGIK